MARSPANTARLEAVAAAKALHLDLESRARLELGEGQIDVFGAIESLGITLVFKPLTSALGLCLPSPLRGIIITTERVLSIQRFTAAHELGHAVLDHSGSIDRTLNYRSGFAADLHDLQEIATLSQQNSSSRAGSTNTIYRNKAGRCRGTFRTQRLSTSSRSAWGPASRQPAGGWSRTM